MIALSEIESYVNDRNSDPTRTATGYSGRVWPNGEFTLGYVPPKKQSEKEKQYDADWRNQYEWFSREYDPQWRGFGGLMAWSEYQHLASLSDIVSERRVTRVIPGTGLFSDVLIVQFGVLKPLDFDSETPENSDPHQAAPIGLSPPPNSHNSGDDAVPTRSRRGSKGITGHEKRMIRNTAEMMQTVYGRRRLGFLTLTLPSFADPFTLQLLAHDFAELMRAFVQEFMREIARAGGPKVYTGCIELQERRYENRGEIAPHLHIVYPAHPGNYAWYISADKIRELWLRVIRNRLDYWGVDGGEFDTKAAVDCQKVKESAAAYLSKYLSKGGKIVEDIKERGDADLLPTAWSTCCNALRKAVKGLTTELGSDIKRAIVQGVDLVRSGFCQWIKNIEIERDGVTRSYGWVGKIAGQRINPLQVMPYLEAA